jgi:hypothetical protein
MGLSSEFVRRINGGEAFDVIAAPPAALDELVANGKVAAGSSKCAVRQERSTISGGHCRRYFQNTCEHWSTCMLRNEAFVLILN